ncbi:Bug family tripartite tricarboxylate transporter substrate binding protein [Achromobacter aloeverae]
MKLSFGCISLCMTALAAPAGLAVAAGFPDHPIRLIAPYEPGGGVDLMARQVAKNLSEALNGISIVVENRPGAGGVVGTQVVVNSKPDGYTLLLASPSPVVIAPYLLKNMSYDAAKDLEPITLIADIPAIMVVKKDAPYSSPQDLIAAAKAEPNKLTYASSGVGGTGHLAALMMNILGGVKMREIPYRGTNTSMTAVMSGEVTMAFADMVSGLGMVKSGQLKGLAITTPGKSPALPSLPSLADVLPGYNAGVWYGLFAPARTPQPIIDALNKAMAKAAASPDMQHAFGVLGFQPQVGGPRQFAEFLKADSERWGKILRGSGITPQ